MPARELRRLCALLLLKVLKLSAGCRRGLILGLARIPRRVIERRAEDSISYGSPSPPITQYALWFRHDPNMSSPSIGDTRDLESLLRRLAACLQDLNLMAEM